MLTTTFDPHNWAAVPFHFWSLVFFVFGSIVGSFLNVCIHRLPLGQSVVSPPSHCPHCQYSIPWYLNIPLVTWVYLGARCRNCGAPIAARYFLVELLTAVVFLCCWLEYGAQSAALALVYAFFLSGLIAATFIDIEYLIIPDEITIGGMVAGFVLSFFLPALQGESSVPGAVKRSLLGMAVGAGVIYAIARAGKLWLGRHRIEFPKDSRVIFTETELILPEEHLPLGDVFYRASDVVTLQARQVELVDRCYRDVTVRLQQGCLEIGGEKLNPEEVPHLEVVCDEIVLPREAMGLGDTKFMGAIGAFLGWKAVFFSIIVSSIIGSAYGMMLIVLRKKDWSSQVYYGPFLALGAAVWVFGGERLIEWWFAIWGGLARSLALCLVP